MSDQDLNAKKDQLAKVPLHPVHIAPLGTINAFQITEDELNRLAEGSEAGLFLNFSLSLLSVGLTFMSVLLVTPIESDRTFIVFTIICVAAIIAGTVLFSLWWKLRTKQERLISKIRRRMPRIPGEQEGQAYAVGISDSSTSINQ